MEGVSVKIPDSVEVFGKKVPVKLEEIDNNFGGFFYPYEWKIIVNKNIPHEEYFRVLLHESFHAVFTRTAIDQSVPYEVEQIIVENMARFIVENFELKPKKKAKK